MLQKKTLTMHIRRLPLIEPPVRTFGRVASGNQAIPAEREPPAGPHKVKHLVVHLNAPLCDGEIEFTATRHPEHRRVLFGDRSNYRCCLLRNATIHLQEAQVRVEDGEVHGNGYICYLMDVRRCTDFDVLTLLRSTGMLCMSCIVGGACSKRVFGFRMHAQVRTLSRSHVIFSHLSSG